MAELTKEKNKVPLPPVPAKHGLRLPPAIHYLTSINFQLILEPRPFLQRAVMEDVKTAKQSARPSFPLQANDTVVPNTIDPPLRDTPLAVSVLADASSQGAETDYDMLDADSLASNLVTSPILNENRKRTREEDDNYDF